MVPGFDNDKVFDVYKLNELKEFVDQHWQEMEDKANPKHIRGKRWRATIIKTHDLRAANEN